MQGTIVAIKMLSLDMKKYPKLELTRQHLMDFKRMKDLQHDHITRLGRMIFDLWSLG